MTYKRLGLAALLVSALRSAVTNPEQETVDEAQQAQIDGVRGAIDGLTETVASLRSRVESGEQLEASHAEELAGIESELNDLADALTGPADDTSDNGVIAEVQPLPDAPTSGTADSVVSDAVDAGIEVPEPVAVAAPAAEE